MRITVYLCLLGSPLLALLGCHLRRYLPPATAVKTMTVLALGAATATVWGLVLLAAAGLGRTGEAVMLFDTNPVAADATDPVPRWFGAAAVALLAVAAVRAARVLWVRHAVNRLVAGVGGPTPPGQLVVFTDEEPHAYAIPGRRGSGRIVVSTAMLRALDPGERRALFAHERAHLRHHHHRYQAAVSIAAALNPLLSGLRAEIDFQIERWADEAAAESAGRTVTAHSLARAALATLHPTPSTGLGFVRHAVPDRVRALQQAPVPARLTAVIPAAIVTVGLAAALGDATVAFADIIEALNR